MTKICQTMTFEKQRISCSIGDKHCEISFNFH